MQGTLMLWPRDVHRTVGFEKRQAIPFGGVLTARTRRLRKKILPGNRFGDKLAKSMFQVSGSGCNSGRL